MNIFNRIIMIILMLCLIVFSIVTIVNIFFVNLFKWSTVADSIISYVNNLNLYILTAVLSFVLVIALIILIFEFYRRKIKHANISTDQSGKTMVTLKTAAMQIRGSLNNIQGMIDPKVKVIPKHDGIIINIFSKLITGISVADKTKEIRETASNFASKYLGFKVLQTNYTATGFITKKVKEVKVIKEEELKEIKQ
ncbi:MAG: alkaline shock response membrane anchor protein AmaP [Candidatus Hydromicrobium sp.]|nr:alkaline shock response membrane anchor protein AmaP [Candidatus Hydromicrobium sp.]